MCLKAVVKAAEIHHQDRVASAGAATHYRSMKLEHWFAAYSADSGLRPVV